MKTKLLIIATFAMVACVVCAQDYSSYLNKAMVKLEVGDCAGAQKMYNVYKELSGKSMSSVEVLIEDCNKERIYSIGDTMIVGGQVYTVAYVRDEGKHGLAVCSKGWNYLCDTDYYITQKKVPTLAELKLIYENRDLLRFYERYWTCTQYKYQSSYCYTIDFSTGDENGLDRCASSGISVVLLVKRF